MAVTTVRTRRTPRPPTSLRKTAVAMARGTPIRAARHDLLEGADDGVEDSHVVEGVGVGDLEVLLVLGEQRAPVDGRDGLDRHPEDDEDDQPHHEQGGADHQHGDHPVGGHLALDDLGGAEPGEAQEDQVPADEEPERRPRAGSVGRRPPTPGRTTRRRHRPAGRRRSSRRHWAGWAGQPPRPGRHVRRGPSAGGGGRSARRPAVAVPVDADELAIRTPGGAVWTSWPVVTGPPPPRCATG